MSSALVKHEAPSLVDFNGDQIALIKRTICKPKEREATNDELALFVGQAKRTGLDPFSRQIYAMFRKSRGEEKMTIQTAIDGFRLIAERSGHYIGQSGPYWCDEDGAWLEIWPKRKGLPVASKVVVRKLIAGQVAETSAVAHWDEYAVYYGPNLSDMWKNMPALMLAKCAEALALRKAFPNDLSGLYTGDEMGRADITQAPPPLAPVSDIPANPSDLRGPDPAKQDFVAYALEGGGEELVDEQFANEIREAMKRLNIADPVNFRKFMEEQGVAGLPSDLRSGAARVAVIQGLERKRAGEIGGVLAAREKALNEALPLGSMDKDAA